MATITQKKKGKKWYAIYVDEHGKQKWKTGYNDRAETLVLAKSLEDDARKIRLGEVNPKQEANKVDRAKGISDHLTQYKTSLQAAGRHKNHVGYTIGDIQKFIDFSATTHAVNITRSHVDAWVLSLIQGKADANRTINRRVGSLQAFLKWLDAKRIGIDYDLFRYPKLKMGGIHCKVTRRALSKPEVIKFLKKTPDPDRLDVWRFDLGSGARKSAVIALQVKDINYQSQTMELLRKAKGGGKYVVPIMPALISILEKRTAGKGPEDYVFADAIDWRKSATLVRADCKAAGIDTTNVDFHCLRHTFISQLAAAKYSPKMTQELAGHATLEQTMKFYTHFVRADKIEALESLAFA